jgi:hypothetical protein
MLSGRAAPSPELPMLGNAGLTAIWLNRAGAKYPNDLQPSDHTITSLAELDGLLADRQRGTPGP